MAQFLLDCNHLSAALQKVSRLRDRLWQEHRAGHRLGTCLPALCELEVGIAQTEKPEEYRRRLRNLMAFVRIWPLEGDLVGFFAEAYLEAKSKGRVLSQIDLILAALARQKSTTLLTTDRDFEAFPDLKIENWVV